MSNFSQQIVNNNAIDWQEMLNQQYEKSRTIAKKTIDKLIQDRLPDLSKSEIIQAITQYTGYSERTIMRQLQCGTVQTQQKPGRDFAIKLAFMLNLHYYETQGLLAKTAHSLLNFSDTSSDCLRDLIIAQWLNTDENDISDGTRLSKCIETLEMNNCALI